MPEPGSKIMFQNHQRKLPAPFVIYADFESITEKGQGSTSNNNDSYTKAYQKNTDCSSELIKSSAVMMINT